MGSMTKKQIRQVMDAFENAYSGFGGSKDPMNLSAFKTGKSLNQTDLEDLYTYDWLSKRIVDTYPLDALREGYTLNMDSEDEAAIFERLSELDWDDVLFKAATDARLYGGSAIIVGAMDGREPHEPLNINAINGINFLQNANRYELDPWTYYSDPESSKIGQPEVYTYHPIYNTVQPHYYIHESRIIVFKGDYTAKNKKIRNIMWDNSCLTATYEALKTYGISIQAAGQLLHDFITKVWTLPDLASYLESADGESNFEERMKLMIQSNSNVGAITLGENEKFEKLATPIAGLADIIKTIAKNASSASGIPESRLFGESLGQLSGAEHSQRVFYDNVRSYQMNNLKTPIEKMIDYLLYDRTFPMNYDSTQYKIEFNSLYVPTPKEFLEQKKMQTEIDKMHIEMGVLSEKEVRESAFGGDEYNFERTLDDDAYETMQEEAKEEVMPDDTDDNI